MWSQLNKFYSNNLYFLKVIKHLSEISQTVRIYIAGSGDRRLLDSFIHNNNLLNRVFYIGFSSNIYDLINQADIFLATYPIEVD